MPGHLVVVVFVATADVGVPSTTALVTASHDALGNATIILEPVAVLPTDAEAERQGEELHATAVVEVTWTLPARDHAHIRVCAEKKCTDRDLSFTPADDANERGRAVGLAIATMIPPAPTSAPTPTPTPTPTPAPAPPPAPIVRPLPAPPRPWHLELDAAFASAWGSSGVGYEAATRLHTAGVSIGVGVGARFGRIEAASIDATTVRVSVGVGLDLVRTERFTAGVALDALALRHDLHREYGSELVEQARWIGGFDVLGNAAWWLTDPLAVFASGGVELGFGETRVLVGDSVLATIPRVRALVLAGLRLRF